MKKFFPIFAASLLMAVNTAAFAAGTGKSPEPLPGAPVSPGNAAMPSAHPAAAGGASSMGGGYSSSRGSSGGGAGADASAPAGTTPDNAMPAEPQAVSQSIILELKDGSKVEILSDSSVNIIGNDGGKTAAPDGVYTLKNDTTFNVKNGKKVD